MITTSIVYHLLSTIYHCITRAVCPPPDSRAKFKPYLYHWSNITSICYLFDIPCCCVLFVYNLSETLSLASCSGSDGLVKLWTIKTNECVKTLDAHQDKVWGLHTSSKDCLMVTGSADSNIIVWKVSVSFGMSHLQIYHIDKLTHCKA